MKRKCIIMESLNLPPYPVQTRVVDGKQCIYDVFRKKYVALTPEEWVRQHFLHWMVQYKGYPAGLIAVESALKYNKLQKRADAIVYTKTGIPIMMIECKASSVEITQAAVDQVALYNAAFGVNYLVITNGKQHFCFFRSNKNHPWQVLLELPDYETI